MNKGVYFTHDALTTNPPRNPMGCIFKPFQEIEVKPQTPPANVILIDGDIFEQPGVLVHQTNTVTVGRAAGLAKEVFARFPSSNEYVEQVVRTPGTVHIFDVSACGAPTAAVVNLYGQTHPGKPKPGSGDDASQRTRFFASALEALKVETEQRRFTRILFPHTIGCGLAGGDWNAYKQMIFDFARTVQADVFIVKHIQ